LFAESPQRATLIATLTDPAEQAAATLRRLSPAVDWVEIRADLCGEIEPSWLRRHTDKKLLYTLRSTAEGGASEASPVRRGERLGAALDAGYDFVDLEAARDLADPELLARIPPPRRILSWHGGPTSVGLLKERFETLSAVPAHLYKLVPAATQPGEDLAPLLFLHELGRRDVAAFATGPAGFWTRLVAPRLGAPVVYGSAGETPAAPGQPSVAALVRDYGLPSLPPAEALYGVVGNPVLHSLSPRLHNGACHRFGFPGLYVPFHVETFGDFWLEVVEGGVLEAIGLPLRGLSVTAPFKDVALAVAGVSSPLAQKIGAANTLFWEDGVWEAEITDPEGVTRPLADRGVALAGIATVVIGAGGAGRAAAVGLSRAGARVTLANRGRERGERAARELGLPFVPLDELDVGAFELVLHATSLGRNPGEMAPVDIFALAPGAVVVDLVYRGTGASPGSPELTQATELVRQARQRGLIAIDGREVLLAQALGQFRLMTGLELPLEVGREILDLAAAGAPSRDAVE